MSETEQQEVSPNPDSRPAPKFRTLNGIAGLMLWAGVIIVLMKMWNAAEKDSQTEKQPPPPATSPDSETPPKRTVITIPRKPVRDFSFTDSNGEQITNADLLGKQWVICFIFTRCAGPCPRVSSKMATLQDAFTGDELQLVTLTVDPEYDDSEALTKYAELFRADLARWTFLTGDQTSI